MLSESDEPSLLCKVINLSTGAVSIEQVSVNKMLPRSTSVSKLTRRQIKRAKEIYPRVGYLINQTLNGWIKGFTYDLHPEREIQFWESLATIFEKYNNSYQLTINEKRGIIYKLMKLMVGEKLQDGISRELVRLLVEEQATKASIQRDKQPIPEESIDYRMLALVYQEYSKSHKLRTHDDVDKIFVALTRLMEGNKAEDKLGKQLLEVWKRIEEEESNGETLQGFNPDDIKDERQRSTSATVDRPGQKKFRRQLLEAYSRRCSITGYDVEQVLEAAHIVPYFGPKADHPSNGLLLRVDIHKLFDTHCLSINPKTNKIEVAPSLKNSSYEDLAGQPLRTPKDKTFRPSIKALEQHYQTFSRRFFS